VLGLLIVIVLVAVPLVLVARLSIVMLGHLFGAVSRSEVATRAEFARIREQLLLSPDSARGLASDPPAPPVLRWRVCPRCGASASSAASICVRCGGALSAD
jgi:hypothetical protein